MDRLISKIESNVVCGFPATGKSYYCNSEPTYHYVGFAVDSDSSKFDKSDFPRNYIEHIKSCIGENKYVFVSTHKEVRESLVKEGINFTLVYPNASLRMEYLKRYIERGNNEQFIDFIWSNWYELIDDLSKQKGCKHLVLNSGQYISDLNI